MAGVFCVRAAWVPGPRRGKPFLCSRSIPQGLQRGDQLLAVNGIDVAEKSHDHVIDCIARERSSGRLQLTVLRVPGLAQDWGATSNC